MLEVPCNIYTLRVHRGNKKKTTIDIVAELNWDKFRDFSTENHSALDTRKKTYAIKRQLINQLVI